METKERPATMREIFACSCEVEYRELVGFASESDPYWIKIDEIPCSYVERLNTQSFATSVRAMSDKRYRSWAKVVDIFDELINVHRSGKRVRTLIGM